MAKPKKPEIHPIPSALAELTGQDPDVVQQQLDRFPESAAQYAASARARAKPIPPPVRPEDVYTDEDLDAFRTFAADIDGQIKTTRGAALEFSVSPVVATGLANRYSAIGWDVRKVDGDKPGTYKITVRLQG